MNKKYFGAWALTFVVWMFGSFIVHGALLQPDYAQLSAMFRTGSDAQQFFPFMLIAHVLLSAAFVWVYLAGIKTKSWLGQGFRYGVAIAYLTVIPNCLIYYAVQPMPGMLVIKQIVFDTILLVILGVLIAFIYRDRAR